jgi:hypothetical protein
MYRFIVLLSIVLMTESVLANCFSSMFDIRSRRLRSQDMAKLMDNNEIRGLKKYFWEAHDADVMPGYQPDKGFYRLLRRFNGASHVPALHQTKNKITGDVDAFSTIFHAADDAVEYSHYEKQAVDDILDWLGEVQLYRKKMNELIEQGMEQKKQFDILSSKKKEFKKMNFPREVEMPVIIEGQVVQSSIKFETIDDLFDYIRDAKRKTEAIFAQNWLDEATKRSKLYNEMIQYAVKYRRIELAYQRINRIPLAKLSSDQQVLREMLEQFLNSKHFRPRNYAYKHVRGKEFWAEVWAALKMWKSKRIANDAKYPLPTKILEKASSLTPVGIFLRFAALSTVAGTAVLGPIAIVYEDNPWVQYVTSYIANWWNDFIVFTIGAPSAALADCYKSERPWSTEEGSTMNKFVEAHLSQYTAYERIDPSYNAAVDEPDNYYTKRKLELQAICSKKRLEYKAARRHVENKQLLKDHGYRFASHLALIEMIEAEEIFRSGDKQKAHDVSQALYEYFEESEVFENTEKSMDILGQVRKLKGQTFVERLIEYQKNIPKAVEAIRRGDFDLYAPSTDAYFEKIRLYKE